jgi:segregation and condensation protein B
MTLPRVLEALLFASPKPLTIPELRSALKSAADTAQGEAAVALAQSGEEDVRETLVALAAGYAQTERGFGLSEGAAGWQLTSAADCAAWVRQLFPENRPARLSPPALETLAIIAYRQPLARSEVEAVRGVDAGGVIQTLLDRGLVRISGRAELPGRPLLYATTQLFLEHFGVKDVSELPAFAELRKVLIEREAEPEGAERMKDEG